jgi:hypothetical protein
MSALDAHPRSGARAILLPDARGPLTELLFAALRESPRGSLAHADLTWCADPLEDDDLQLALYVAYELHYTAIAGVDDRWEWAPELLGFRGLLEQRFEHELGELVERVDAVDPSEVGG